MDGQPQQRSPFFIVNIYQLIKNNVLHFFVKSAECTCNGRFVTGRLVLFLANVIAVEEAGGQLGSCRVLTFQLHPPPPLPAPPPSLTKRTHFALAEAGGWRLAAARSGSI